MATKDLEFNLKAKPEEGNGDFVMGNGDIVMGIVGIMNFRRALLTL